MPAICAHAASGCNHPEAECAGLCDHDSDAARLARHLKLHRVVHPGIVVAARQRATINPNDPHVREQLIALGWTPPR